MAAANRKKRQRCDTNDVKISMVVNNHRAVEEGPARKHWSTHDLLHLRPLTENQKLAMHHFSQGDQMLLSGSPGTGKTFLSVYLSMGEVLHPDSPQDHLIIIRSAVATRDQGFLPGTLEEKQSVFEQPYKDIFAHLFGRAKTYDDMKDARLVQFMSTSYLRGLTWDNAFVLVDECQNMTFHELNSIMTRIGTNSRIVFAGDIPQCDLLKTSRDVTGMQQFQRIVSRMDEFTEIAFTHEDIVRSNLVKSWIIASEQESKRSQ